jgi:hypothetical protein
MNRTCRGLEILTRVEKFQIRLKLKCVKLWSGELGVVDCEPAVSGWLPRKPPRPKHVVVNSYPPPLAIIIKFSCVYDCFPVTG